MNSKSYWIRPLNSLEMTRNDGFTHVATITANDLSNATNGATQAITFGILPAGTNALVEIRNTVPFKDASDATFDLTTVSIGDTGSATSILAAQELNVNGTEVGVVRSSLSSLFATDTDLIATFTPKAGKNLNAVDIGQLDILVKIINPNPKLNTQPLVGMTK